MNFEQYLEEKYNKWSSSLPKDEALNKTLDALKKKKIKKISEDDLSNMVGVDDSDDADEVMMVIRDNFKKYKVKVT